MAGVRGVEREGRAPAAPAAPADSAALLAELEALAGRWRLGAVAGLDPAGLTPEQALRLAMRLSTRLGTDVRVPDVLASASLPELVRRAATGALGAGAGVTAPLGGRVGASGPTGGSAGVPVPLSHGQQRFLLDETLAPGQDDNHVVLAYLLSGPLDPDALTAAYDDVVRRHPILRTVHYWDDEHGPLQRVLPPDPGRSPPAAIPTACLPQPTTPTTAAAEICADWWDQPFDLEEHPPLRARLARLGPESWLLCLSLHHIVFDGRSELILLEDLATAYAARASGRAPGWEPVPGYHHYAQWEHDMVERWADRDLPFWRELLDTEPPPLLPAPALTDQAARHEHEIVLDAGAVGELSAAVRTRGSVPLASVLYGTARALGRVFCADRLNLATVASGRFESVFNPVIGCFVNPVVLPFEAVRDGRAEERVAETARLTLRALRHARTPYDRLVRSLRPGVARVPLYEVMVALQAPLEAGSFGGTELVVEPVRVRAPRAGAPLVVEVEPQPDGGWAVAARWRGDVVDERSGREVVDEVASLLTALRAR
ncbi:condensation domain-containing protein [Nonomuraea gerenzanensis]|nr:condensation domain-containing protein [Nonomuraea gerenzanensis]UBU11345.1 condensation domain-containing protein [Nonomuraea gerenzanensis]